MEGHGCWEIGDYANALASYGEYRRIIEFYMTSDEIHLDTYRYPTLEMQTHHWAALLEEAGCLVKLNRIEEAKEKVERAQYILLHAWRTKDGSVDYLAQEPERYLMPFCRIYTQQGLDALGECPV